MLKICKICLNKIKNYIHDIFMCKLENSFLIYTIYS